MGALVTPALLLPVLLVVAHPHPHDEPPGPWRAPDLAATLQSARAATPQGAATVIDTLHDKLLAPRGQVRAVARALCRRYLDTAREHLAPDADCALRARALEADAMCRWLAAEDGLAQAGVQALTVHRCATVNGLDRALALAVRWARPDLVRAWVEQQVAGLEGRGVTGPQLDQARERQAAVARATWQREAVGAAFGAETLRPGLLVTAVRKGSPAGRAGLRRGDVLLTVGARPVTTVTTIAGALPADRAVAIAFLRAGQRKAGMWSGPAEGLEAVGVPER